MTPINKQTIQAKLVLLEKNITLLRSYQQISKKVFLEDYTVQGAAMHYLVESIEIIVNIGNHILAEQFGQAESTYKDIILSLGKHKIIPNRFAQQHATMTDFRNLIIHGYAEVKLMEVYKAVQSGPSIFERFSRYFVRYIEKK
ncbi:MAG: DUF86 domain-containing protein [Candidatus Kerfeldbacteria bacterium]|nr:DUF86 domain-containing protein [Candidatus Kerfeldbacteria bacterium]